jgi:PEP-CTERM motif-containing protein
LKSLIVVTALAVLLCHHSSFAAVETMDLKFSGIDWESNGTPADATVRLVFNPVADMDPATNIGSYLASASLLSGGSSGNAESQVTVTVQHDVSGDVFAMSDASFASPFVNVDGQLVNNVRLSLTASAGAMFSSDALPVDPNFASNASAVTLFLTHGDSEVGFGLPAPSVSITVVPEPSTHALLAMGMLGLLVAGGLRRRRA